MMVVSQKIGGQANAGKTEENHSGIDPHADVPDLLGGTGYTGNAGGQEKGTGKVSPCPRCWKGYDHDLLNKLSEEGLINAAGRTYPALITPEGEAEARKLLAQYGIDTEERRRCSAER